MTPWGDFNFSFLDLQTCAGTHTRAQTHIYMPNLAILSEQFHLAILLSLPLQKKGISYSEKGYWGESDINWVISNRKAWVLNWNMVCDGGRGWYLAGSIFFSLECGTFAPHYKAFQDQIILLYCPSHNRVHLSFPVSSLKIWQVNLNQGLR